MSIVSAVQSSSKKDSAHDDFLELAPVVERHAGVVFRHLDTEAREEAVSEAVAAAFEAHIKLKARERSAYHFPSVLAHFAVLHVKDDRHVGGRSSSRDVLSRKAQQRRGFRVVPLPMTVRTGYDNRYAQPHGQRQQDLLEECLRDNTQSPVVDQVIFRIDFPVFLKSLTARDRQMAMALAQGHAAKQVAERFHVTAGRVTQLRQLWKREWDTFQQDTEGLTAQPNSL